MLRKCAKASEPTNGQRQGFSCYDEKQEMNAREHCLRTASVRCCHTLQKVHLLEGERMLESHRLNSCGEAPVAYPVRYAVSFQLLVFLLFSCFCSLRSCSLRVSAFCHMGTCDFVSKLPRFLFTTLDNTPQCLQETHSQAADKKTAPVVRRPR